MADWKSFPGKLAEWVKDTVWPEQALCLCCHRVLRKVDRILQPETAEPLVCAECLDELEDEKLVDDFTTVGLFLQSVSAFPYGGHARHLVIDLKYNTQAAAAEVMIPYLAEAAKKIRKLPPDTVITWVTMPPNRKLERCIDHGRLLAEGTAKALGLECRQLLIRKNGGHPQQGLSERDRKTNVKGRFSVCEGELPASVLLVDDVLTTGSTLEECAKVLREAGVREVRGLTVCKA